MKKLLKGVSLALVAVLIATTSTIGFLPGEKSYAAVGEYVALQSDTGISIIPGPWKFSDALDNTKMPQLVEKDTSALSKWSIYKVVEGFKWKDGSKYDIKIKLTGRDTFEERDYNFVEGRGDQNSINVISFKTDDNSTKAYSIDYEIWLEYPVANPKAGQKVPSSEVSLIIGPCWTSPNELNYIWSNDATLYTSIPTVPMDLKYYNVSNVGGTTAGKAGVDGSAGIETWDNPLEGNYYKGFAPLHSKYNNTLNYFVGLGSKDDIVKGSYTATNSSTHALELRVGYRSYSVNYVLATGSQAVNVKPTASGSTVNLSSPSHVASEDVPLNHTPEKATVTASVGNVISYMKVKSIDTGESDKDLKYKNGTPVKVGDIIEVEDIDEISMNHHLTVEIMAVSVGTKYKLEYDLGVGTYDTPFPDDKNYGPKNDYSPGQVSSNQTQYVKNSIYTGKDGKRYRFLGWFDEDTDQEFTPGTSKVVKDTKVIGKWEPYVPAPSYSYTPSSVTLSFDTNGNGGYDKPGSQSGNSGFTGKVPSDIKVGDIIDGYKFTGWFKDKDGKEPFDFKTGISTNTTAYAGWEKVDENTTPDGPLVKVEFETEIGVPPATQVETPGNTAEDPGAPMDINTLKPGTVINGYRFEGWYLDKEYKVKYDFSAPVTEDIILYAKWTAVVGAKSPKTGEPISPLAGGVATGLACLAILGLLIRMSAKRRREDI